MQPPPCSTPLPYTTPFRSHGNLPDGRNPPVQKHNQHQHQPAGDCLHSPLVEGMEILRVLRKPDRSRRNRKRHMQNVCHTNRNDISRPHFPGPYASRRKTYVPPAFGIAAPSSLQTHASSIAIAAPATHASIACGPPIALITSELTTNGPMPTISIMLSATASFSPSPRSSCSPASFACLFSPSRIVSRE